MNKVLKLLIDDFTNKESSAVYKVALHRFCDAERLFMASLDNEQKKEYLKLGCLHGDLDIISENELALYLFLNLKEFL